MSEPTEQANAAADAPSIGQQVDQLVADVNGLTASIRRYERDLAEATARLRDKCGALADAVGRPAAARLLGITPRDLAGILRGARGRSQ